MSENDMKEIKGIKTEWGACADHVKYIGFLMLIPYSASAGARSSIVST